MTTTGIMSSPQPPARRGYAGELRPLLGLQFVAVGWVVLNQFSDHPVPALGRSVGLVGKGYLGAALFFVAAGFLLANLYARAKAQGRFGYWRLAWRAFVRLYPLQLAGTLAMVALVLTGAAANARPAHGVFPWRDLVAHLLMLQAWGVLPTDTWDFPTWFASALWFGVLIFPATAWLALRSGRQAALVIGGALALFWSGFALAAARHALFTDMTTQIGALQTAPAFLLGAGLYQLGLHHSLPSLRWARLLALAATAWIVAAASAGLSDAAIWPAFGPLVFGLAEIGRSKGAGAGLWLSRLARLSIPAFMVYLPAEIVYFHALRPILGRPTGWLALVELVGVFPAILAAAALAHHLVERPAHRLARAWLR